MSHYKIHFIITISTRLVKYILKCIHREKKARGKWRVDLKEYIKKDKFNLDGYGDSLKAKKKNENEIKVTKGNNFDIVELRK